MFFEKLRDLARCDPRRPGRFGDLSPVLRQDFPEVRFFGISGAELTGVGQVSGPVNEVRRRKEFPGKEVAGKALRPQDRRRFNNVSPLDEVFQLPNISRPSIVFQGPEDFGMDVPDLLGGGPVQLFQELLDEQRDVFRPLPERRDLDGENVEAVVKVLPEQAPVAHDLEVHVGRGDHPDVRLDGFLPADTLKNPVLEDLEKLDLGGGRDGPDFIEEDGPPLGDLELAELPPHRPGKGPFLVPEKFAFHEGVRNRPAVDADEPGVSPAARLVDDPRHDALARPRFPEKEHGASRRRHGSDLVEDRPHLRAAGPEDFLDVHLPDPVPEIVELGLDDQGFGDALHDIANLVGIERIGQVVAGPGFHGHDGFADDPGLGHDDDLDIGKGHPEGLQGFLVTVPGRRGPEEGKVDKNEIVMLLLEGLETRLDPGRVIHPELSPETLADLPEGGRIPRNDKDGFQCSRKPHGEMAHFLRQIFKNNKVFSKPPARPGKRRRAGPRGPVTSRRRTVPRALFPGGKKDAAGPFMYPAGRGSEAETGVFPLAIQKGIPYKEDA